MEIYHINSYSLSVRTTTIFYGQDKL